MGQFDFTSSITGPIKLHDHSARHENEGADEISLTSLSGDPADTINESLLTTQNDIIVRGASIAERLNIGASKIVARLGSGNVVAATGAQVIALLTGANLDVGAFDVRGQTVTADALTSGRVVFAGTAGVLSDDSDFTFATDTLTVTKIGAFQATGAINFDSQNMTNVDIDSGTIDGVTITSPNINEAVALSATASELNLLDLAGLTAGELLVATAATTAAWQSTGVILSAPDISGTVSAATTLTMPAFTAGGDIIGQATYDLGSAASPFAEAYIGNTNDYLKVAIVGNIPTIYGMGAYTRFGDAGVTNHALTSEDDVLITGKLEVNNVSYFDEDIHLYSPRYFQFDEGATGIARIDADTGHDQFEILVSSNVGTQVILGHYAWRGTVQDFDHADQANPTLFIHSATAPNTANDEWISFTHDVTDGVIDTGSGVLKLGHTGGVDINSGTIDGATIATSDVTVGAGKTLDVSAGTLTLADNQISGDKVEGGTIAAITITTLTSDSVDGIDVSAHDIATTGVHGAGANTILYSDHTADADAHGDAVITADTNSATADDLNFSIVGGEGIDTSGATSVITITGEAASTTNKGVVELATGAETNTGTSTTLAVTPDGLDDWTGSAQITTVGTLSSGDVTAQVGDATTGTKGIASFNSESFTVSSGAVSLVLDDTPVDGETNEPITSNWAFDHAALASAHGAVSAATASKIVLRDAEGQAKFAAPAEAGDALIKGTPITSGEYPAVTDEYYLVGTGTSMEERAVPTAGKSIATGTYNGDNSDNRQITTGFKCSLVILFSSAAAVLYIWLCMPDGITMKNAGDLVSNAIATDALLHATDGFVVDQAHANDTTRDPYYYWAISE